MTYQQEKDNLLTYIINNGIFSAFKKPHEQKDTNEQQLSLELYITPDCNQTCSYCYLCKYKNELYPQELRDPATIIKNTEILLNYLIENELNPYRFDLFSGEIWGLPLGQQLLEVVYQAVKKGFKPHVMIIPSNFSFVLKDDTLAIIDDYMQKFQDAGVRLCFSCSNDGLYLDQMTRPLNDENEFELKKGTEVYYNRIFDFCIKWGLGFHPMVSAHGIEHWKENFKWWMDELHNHECTNLNSIMFLEVRNDDWTDEKIRHYLEYLNYSIDYLINTYFARTSKDSLDMFCKYVHHKLDYMQRSNYSPLMLSQNRIYPGCTIHRSLVVRMGDLAIIPCHRTSYDEFIGGYFNVENDKIIGVSAKNIQVMNQVWLNNHQGTPKCGNCPYTSHCMKGCFGSQFESTGDLLYPCETVCDLYKARLIFLYHKYSKLNILLESDADITQIMEKVKNTEDYAKWTQISQEII